MNTREQASNFAHFIKGLGFTVYLAKSGTHGFITDDTCLRVLSFEFTDGGKLHGNYGPPSQNSGTGWRLEQAPHDLVTAFDVMKALYQPAPTFCGNGWEHYTTLEQHLKLYGDSSQYAKI